MGVYLSNPLLPLRNFSLNFGMESKAKDKSQQYNLFICQCVLFSLYFRDFWLVFSKYPEENTDYSEPTVFLQVTGGRGKRFYRVKRLKRLKDTWNSCSC